jgi:D-3-phosphoglycerate dehydrogenase / 2-oxoglutarate reductase
VPRVVLVVEPIRPEGMRLLEARPDVAVEVIDRPTPALMAAAVPRADAVVIRTTPLTADLIDAAPGLKVVSRHGVGYDSVDVEALTRRRIPLAVAATSNNVAVAEHAFAMLLALAKRLPAFDAAVREGRWARRDGLDPPLELAGKALLLVGFGRIGREVARRARTFAMRVLVHDPLVPPEEVVEAGCEPVPSLRAALPEAHAVSLHLPLSPATRGLIGASELALMRGDAVLLNTARGGLVDEAALALALREGRIAAAGLDVLEREPPPADHPLLLAGLPNLLLSPHVAGATLEAMVRMAVESVGNALAALDGRLDPAVVVNPEVLR